MTTAMGLVGGVISWYRGACDPANGGYAAMTFVRLIIGAGLGWKRNLDLGIEN